MTYHPGAFLGDFTAERAVLLGCVPLDALAGLQMRAIHLLAGEALAPDPQNFWVLQVGRVSTGTFEMLAPETSFAGGFAANVARTATVAFAQPVVYSRGDLVAVRLSPRGSPPPLVGLSAVPEWGVQAVAASRR